MVILDKPPVDVVFVVEGTANLGAYIDELKTYYILPTLAKFNGGPPDPIDYGHDYSCTLYNLVTYFSADIAPDSATRCSDLTTSTHEFLTWLDNIKFTGGCGECHSHISEGLRTALHVFDDIKEKRNDDRLAPERHCILVCNSPPYHLPSMEGCKYTGYYSDQLAKMFAMRDINLSIISPRKIPALLKLYEASTTSEIPLQTKDFSVDIHHLVLLHGFELEERSHTPIQNDDEHVKNLLATRSPAPPPAGEFKVPTTAPSAMPLQPVSQPGAASTGQVTSQPVQPTKQAPVYQQPPQPIQQPAQQPIQQPPQHRMQQPQPMGQTQQTRMQGPMVRPQGGMMVTPQPQAASQPPQQMTYSPAQVRATGPNQGINPTVASQGAGDFMGNRMPGGNQTMTDPMMSLNNNMSQGMPVQSKPGTTAGWPNQNSGMVNASSAGMNQTISATSAMSGPNGSNMGGQNIGVANNMGGQQMGGGQQLGGQPMGGINNMNMGGANNVMSVPNSMAGQNMGGMSNMGGAGGMSGQGMGGAGQGMGAANTMGQNAATMSAMGMGGGAAPMGGMNNIATQNMVGPNNMAVQGGMQAGLNQQGVAPGIPGPNDQQGGFLQNRNIIWKGNLEWQDKKSVIPGPAARITRSLGCMVSIANTDPDLNTSRWPSVLIMQLMPQALLNSPQLHPLFKNSRQVAFHFQQNTNLDDTRNLYKVMGSGFAGCVHFPPSTACDIRVLLLLFSNKRKSFVGLIPNDQSGVVNGIRQVITQQKQRMQQPGAMAQPNMQTGMAGTMQPNMPGGMMPGAQQMAGGPNMAMQAGRGMDDGMAYSEGMKAQQRMLVTAQQQQLQQRQQAQQLQQMQQQQQQQQLRHLLQRQHQQQMMMQGQGGGAMMGGTSQGGMGGAQMPQQQQQQQNVYLDEFDLAL